MCIVKMMKSYLFKYSNLTMSVKREVSEKNKKFNSNWEERYFFANNSGKPQYRVRLQVISVLKEFLFTRKHTGNATEILENQFWNKWRVTRSTTGGGANGQSPRLRDFLLKMCSPCSKYAKVLSQLWSDWKRHTI